MILVLFHPLALKEYRAAKAWYAKRSAKTALRFREEVRAAIERATTFPQSHPAFSPTIHRVKVRRNPYLVVFNLRSSSLIFVVAIAHGRKRQGYWKRRV